MSEMWTVALVMVGLIVVMLILAAIVAYLEAPTYLWLDDVRTAPKGWTHVKTVEEAMIHIKGGHVSEISFDHDLGTEQTGYDLAKWIEQGAYNKTIGKLNWTIHSANPVGKKNIERAMINAQKFWQANPPPKTDD